VTVDAATIERLYRQANAERWSVPSEAFADAIDASVRKALGSTRPSTREVERYVSTLHLADLALACACRLGHEAAWEHFVLEHRPILYRAADALDPAGGARETADALYAELYGLREEDGERRSLFRHFHGRSSLGTWLRAVLSQRHVDAWRSRRRLDPLPDEEVPASDSPPDPDRPRLLQLVAAALAAAISALDTRDRLRLRSYYSAGMTLAQIGRLTGEHEATVSRQLARTRRLVRDDVERALKESGGLSRAEIERALELAIEDPGGMDLREMLEETSDRKNARADRSG
jgi:RNA polymerase sigma factor (sigma-70 family)